MNGELRRIWSNSTPLTHTAPGAAACWMRAARLTPSPMRSSPCTATSARWRPKRIFSGSTSDPIGARKRYADLDRAAQRVDRAWKLRQRRIAGPVEYPAVERGDLLRYEGLTGRESRDSPSPPTSPSSRSSRRFANHDRRHSTLHGKVSLYRRNVRSLRFILSLSGVAGKFEADELRELNVVEGRSHIQRPRAKGRPGGYRIQLFPLSSQQQRPRLRSRMIASQFATFHRSPRMPALGQVRPLPQPGTQGSNLDFARRSFPELELRRAVHPSRPGAGPAKVQFTIIGASDRPPNLANFSSPRDAGRPSNALIRLLVRPSRFPPIRLFSHAHVEPRRFRRSRARRRGL